MQDQSTACCHSSLVLSHSSPGTFSPAADDFTAQGFHTHTHIRRLCADALQERHRTGAQQQSAVCGQEPCERGGRQWADHGRPLWGLRVGDWRCDEPPRQAAAGAVTFMT